MQVVVRVIVAREEGRAAMRRMGIGLRILDAIVRSWRRWSLKGEILFFKVSAHAGFCGFAQTTRVDSERKRS